MFGRDSLTGNPYEPPLTSTRESSTDRVAPRFPFIAAGPVVGASVGLTHVSAMAGVWAFHDYPDDFFRSSDLAWIGAIMLAIGGAIFGLVYGVVLRLVLNSMSLTIRNRPHFYAAIIASIVVTVIACELSIQRSISVDPLLVLVVIVSCAFAAALATAKRLDA